MIHKKFDVKAAPPKRYNKQNHPLPLFGTLSQVALLRERALASKGPLSVVYQWIFDFSGVLKTRDHLLSYALSSIGIDKYKVP